MFRPEWYSCIWAPTDQDSLSLLKTRQDPYLSRTTAGSHSNQWFWLRSQYLVLCAYELRLHDSPSIWHLHIGSSRARRWKVKWVVDYAAIKSYPGPISRRLFLSPLSRYCPPYALGHISCPFSKYQQGTHPRQLRLLRTRSVQLLRIESFCCRFLLFGQLNKDHWWS